MKALEILGLVSLLLTSAAAVVARSAQEGMSQARHAVLLGLTAGIAGPAAILSSRVDLVPDRFEPLVIVLALVGLSTLIARLALPASFRAVPWHRGRRFNREVG